MPGNASTPASPTEQPTSTPSFDIQQRNGPFDIFSSTLGVLRDAQDSVATAALNNVQRANASTRSRRGASSRPVYVNIANDQSTAEPGGRYQWPHQNLDRSAQGTTSPHRRRVFMSSVNAISRSALEPPPASASTSRGLTVRRRLRQAQAARQAQQAQRRGLQTPREQIQSSRPPGSSASSGSSAYDVWSVPIDDVVMFEDGASRSGPFPEGSTLSGSHLDQILGINTDDAEEGDDDEEDEVVSEEDEDGDEDDEDQEQEDYREEEEDEDEVEDMAEVTADDIRDSIETGDSVLEHLLNAGPLQDDDPSNSDAIQDLQDWVHREVITQDVPPGPLPLPSTLEESTIITTPVESKPRHPTKRAKSRHSFVPESSILCAGRVLWGTQTLDQQQQAQIDRHSERHSERQPFAQSLTRQRDQIQRQHAMQHSLSPNMRQLLVLQERTRRAQEQLAAGQHRTSGNPSLFRRASHSPLRSSTTVNTTSPAELTSTKEEWDVKVTLHTVDYDTGRVAGLMEALNVRTSSSTVVTYFEGEIIDFVNHTLWTNKWRADPDVDLRYWRKLEAFKAMDDRAIVKGLRSPRWLAHLNHKYILMRWKERFFVNVNADDSGLTIAGFYYVSMRRSDGQMEGFYHDPDSQPYQKLLLNVKGPGIGFSDWQLN